jgi:hypothetical protein
MRYHNIEALLLVFVTRDVEVVLPAMQKTVLVTVFTLMSSSRKFRNQRPKFDIVAFTLANDVESSPMGAVAQRVGLSPSFTPRLVGIKCQLFPMTILTVDAICMHWSANDFVKSTVANPGPII